ncbi:hypothetical protein QR680_015344 [Steinernema hermaphroditum]|uniref:Uncharacterized protein n=1 Tax=Steinernema hermaphroditum TaxID=289476 RepID=A0AA39LKP4_9BILA|nr:hypothetical protein QR680_015344 [Steinernema hermaphroditum]
MVVKVASSSRPPLIVNHVEVPEKKSKTTTCAPFGELLCLSVDSSPASVKWSVSLSDGCRDLPVHPSTLKACLHDYTFELIDGQKTLTSQAFAH